MMVIVVEDRKLVKAINALRKAGRIWEKSFCGAE